MSIFKYTFYFKINYVTSYGQRVYVVGDIDSLGNWNPLKSFALEWKENHIWTGNLSINHNPKKTIYYKYVICKVQGEKLFVERWEEGSNRILDLTKTSSLNCVLEEVWRHRKVTFWLKNELEDLTKKSVYIIGDDQTLGGLKSAKKMDYVTKKDPTKERSRDGILERYWEYICFIDSSVTHIKYYYVLYDEKDKKLLWERNKERRIELDPSIEIRQEVKNLPNIKTYQSDCIFFRCKLNRFKKIDTNLMLNFYFTKVNENLIMGSFPYSYEEVEILKREGIKAVLNINTLEEINFTMINWDIITKYYPDTDFELIDFQLIDIEQADINQKVRYAASILHNLIKNYKKVYVHSTLGKVKVNEVIINYLCIYKSFSYEAALKFIKIKRPPSQRLKSKLRYSPNKF